MITIYTHTVAVILPSPLDISDAVGGATGDEGRV